MRAALLTTALVIAALALWSTARRMEVATAGAAGPLPDVAASPDASPTYVPATAGERIHVVAAGETLADLAQRYYGDPARADEIYLANRDRLPARAPLRVGERLVIP